MIDVAIIGSGPSGLSASVYVQRAGYNSTIFTGNTLGGLVTTTDKVDNYLGLPGITGADLAEKFVDHAKKFGVEFVFENIQKIVKKNGLFYLEADGKEYVAKSVIFAAGSTPKKLDVEGESLDGVSYCATCDGLFFENETVIVVGGGDAALEDALYLSKICKKVYVLVRKDRFKSTGVELDQLLSTENIETRFNTSIMKIEGNQDVQKVLLNTGEELTASGVFISVGQKPNSEPSTGNTVLYENNFIKNSKTEGFYVAGDIHNPDYRQIAVAVGDGAKTAIEVTKYLSNKNDI